MRGYELNSSLLIGYVSVLGVIESNLSFNIKYITVLEMILIAYT